MTALGDFSSGDVLTAADMNAIGTWITFTPSWNNFTAGNAVQDWSYCIINDVMIVTGRTVLGTTSSMGTSPSFTIPDSRVADKWSSNGAVSLRENGVATRVGTISVSGPGDSTIGFGAYLVSGSDVRITSVTASSPFTWGNLDYITGTLVLDVT
jgi:hypothetical protein